MSKNRGCREALTHSSKLYIAIEGIDGTGKTHVANHISERFGFVKIQEPSNDELGNFIVNKNWDPLTDFFLFMADRSNFLKDLDPDRNFVSDRSLYSSYAYQGVYLSRKFPSYDDYFSFFMQIGKLLPRIPDFVFVLYSDVDLALDRIGKRGTFSRFEKKEFLEGVQEMYFRLQGRIKNLKFINSNCTLDELLQSIDREIIELLPQDRPL
ncbi:MAG: dTMP kinase [Thermoplasmata archaeon]